MASGAAARVGLQNSVIARFVNADDGTRVRLCCLSPRRNREQGNSPCGKYEPAHQHLRRRPWLCRCRKSRRHHCGSVETTVHLGPV